MRIAGLVSAALVALALAGCGRGTSTPPGPTASPTADPSPTVPPEQTALTLERFQYEATLMLQEQPAGNSAGKEIVISTQGSFQAPDRHAFTYSTTTKGGVLKKSAVVIGDQVWVRNDDEPWLKTTAGDPQAAQLLNSAFSSIRPNFLGGPEFADARASVQRLPSIKEIVNGIPTEHYVVGKAGLQFFRDFLGGEALLNSVRSLDWELWLAEDGTWPVQLLARATVTAGLPILDELNLQPPASVVLRIDISHPNDPSVTVGAPDGG